MRKRDTTRIRFICIELGHLAENYMNIGRIEDEKKEKDNNIRKHMRQQSLPRMQVQTMMSKSFKNWVTSLFLLEFSKENWN